VHMRFRALRTLSCCLLTLIVPMVVLELPSVMLDFNEAVAMGGIPKARHVLSELVLNLQAPVTLESATLTLCSFTPDHRARHLALPEIADKGFRLQFGSLHLSIVLLNCIGLAEQKPLVSLGRRHCVFDKAVLAAKGYLRPQVQISQYSVHIETK
jgi:hypothetical protein